MAEGRAVAFVVAEITVEELALEHVAHDAATVATAPLDHDVAQAEVVDVGPELLRLQVEAMRLPAVAFMSNPSSNRKRTMARLTTLRTGWPLSIWDSMRAPFAVRPLKRVTLSRPRSSNSILSGRVTR
jgi:hypothetical protein